MARYIDADAMKKDVRRQIDFSKLLFSENDAMQEIIETLYDGIFKEIDRMPTADVQEVKRGKWEVYYDDDDPQDGVWKCSACRYIRFIDDSSPTNFCPNCGADMRERSEDAGQ